MYFNGEFKKDDKYGDNIHRNKSKEDKEDGIVSIAPRIKISKPNMKQTSVSHKHGTSGKSTLAEIEEKRQAPYQDLTQTGNNKGASKCNLDEDAKCQVEMTLIRHGNEKGTQTSKTSKKVLTLSGSVKSLGDLPKVSKRRHKHKYKSAAPTYPPQQAPSFPQQQQAPTSPQQQQYPSYPRQVPTAPPPSKSKPFPRLGAPRDATLSAGPQRKIVHEKATMQGATFSLRPAQHREPQNVRRSRSGVTFSDSSVSFFSPREDELIKQDALAQPSFISPYTALDGQSPPRRQSNISVSDSSPSCSSCEGTSAESTQLGPRRNQSRQKLSRRNQSRQQRKDNFFDRPKSQVQVNKMSMEKFGKKIRSKKHNKFFGR